MKRFLFILSLTILLSVELNSQQIVYVTPTGGGSGTSWNDACSLGDILGEHVHLIPIYSSDVIIYISKGDYYLDYSISAVSITNFISLNVNTILAPNPYNSITIYGGFNGESSPDYRDLNNNVTTFHALNNPLYPYSYAPIYIQGDQCYTNMTIDGITITSDGYNIMQPAIYFTWTSDIILRNINIENYHTNTHLMFLEGQGCSICPETDILIEYCSFKYNYASYLCYSGSYLNMDYCYGYGNIFSTGYMIDANCGYYSYTSNISSTESMNKIRSHNLTNESNETYKDISTDYRYYSLSGQFVGNSINILPQGLYVRVNILEENTEYKLIHKY